MVLKGRLPILHISDADVRNCSALTIYQDSSAIMGYQGNISP